jgi:hypothetical protein
MVVKGWEGITSKNKPILFSEKTLHLLFNAKLNVKNGEDSTPFWMWLINQVLDEKTFDADPMV